MFMANYIRSNRFLFPSSYYLLSFHSNILFEDLVKQIWYKVLDAYCGDLHWRFDIYKFEYFERYLLYF